MISMAENEKDIHHKAAAPTQEDSNERKPVSRSRSRGQQRRSQRSVFQYITVLFAAAFLLLLMTYMMQQRLNKAEIDDLQESSNSTLQTLDNIIAERDQLRQENQELSDQLEDALQTAQNSANTVAKQERALQAMDWFWRIQRQFSRGYTRAARELAEQFEASGLVSDLPDVSYAEPDGPSPKQQYAELYDLLF